MKIALMLLGSYVPPIVVGAWGLWCTWVAFTGGVMPVPFVKWNVEGGIGQGLLFLFVITPVLTGIATQLLIWITILCTVVVVAVRGIRAKAGISRMTPETSARLVRADEMESNAIFLAPREPENPFPIQRAPITVLEVDTVPVVDPELIHIQQSSQDQNSHGPTNSSAGWFPDQSDPSVLRWWDGSAWTKHRSGGARPSPTATEIAQLTPDAAPIRNGTVPARIGLSMGVLSVFIFDIYFVGLILTIGAFVFGAIGLHRSPYRRIPGRKTAVWAMSLGGIYFAMTNINLLQQFVNALR